MRPLVLCMLLLGGCAAAGPGMPPDPSGPLAQPEEPLTVETLPGRPAAVWPIAIAQAGGRYLLPWRDASGLHARIIDAGGAGGERDLALGEGSFLGAAGRQGGFVVAVARGSSIAVRFLDGSGEVEVPLGGAPVSSIACDGDAVLVAATLDGDHSLDGDDLGVAPVVETALVRPDGAEALDLGLRANAPTLYGDAAGFVVDGGWLLSSLGASERAPGPQVPWLRLFQRANAVGSSVTVDGSRWLWLARPIDAAFSDEQGLELVAGGELLHLAPDLTLEGSPARVPLAESGRAFLRGVSGDRALWEALDDSDHLFAILDRQTLAPRSPLVRLSGVSSRTVSVALGARDVLLAWLGADGSLSYARWAR